MENITELIRPELPTIQALIGLNAKAGTNVNAIAEQELQFLNMQIITKPFIAKCTRESIVLAIKFAVRNNLSLDPNANLIYLTPLSVKTKNEQGKDVWIDTLEIKTTADGKLSIAYQAGIILDHKRPTTKRDSSGKVIGASVEILLPSVPLPRWEKVEMNEDDFKRLRIFSHDKNSRNKDDANIKDYSNPLYTSFNGGIDPEFACSKVVSLSLKKRGTNMSARQADRIYIHPEPKEVIYEQEPETTYAEVISDTKKPTINLPKAEDL